MSEPALTLRDASERLGLHYMTVYRHVRTGRLRARRHEGTWLLDAAEVDRFVAGRAVAGRRGRPAHAQRVGALALRLLDGDEAGAWSLLDSMRTGGAEPPALYLEAIGPALRQVGEGWARGELTIADEHRATVVAQRLVGRLGPHFRRPGRRRGTVVLGGPEGEAHSLPTAMVADLLRAAGYDAVDLGAGVPTADFVECVLRAGRTLPVGIAVTTEYARPGARRLIGALRAARAGAPIVLGGAGVDAKEAASAGADHWAAGAQEAVRALTG